MNTPRYDALDVGHMSDDDLKEMQMIYTKGLEGGWLTESMERDLSVIQPELLKRYCKRSEYNAVWYAGIKVGESDG